MKTEQEEKKPISAIKGNSGFLHMSKEKSEEKSPDYFGRMNIDGTLYDVAGWKKEPESKEGKPYISLNVDKNGLTVEEKEKYRESALEEYHKRRKEAKENDKDTYILVESTGTMHRQTNADEKEDFFGTILLGGKKVYFKGFSSLSKNEEPMIRLEVSDGLRSKEERNEIADSFL